METKVKEYIDNFLDCFGGADGGVSFVRFKINLSEIEKQANNGNDDAEKIIEVVARFSRLIDAIGRV